MSLSVIKRPQGHVLSQTEVTGVTVSDVGNGDALFNKTAHGLTDGDFIFMKSAVRQYNGFWYADFQTVNVFKLKEYATSDFVRFIADPGDITYFESVLTHGWQCVHLPIVYKLSNTKWPTNSDDTARTVSSTTNDSGYHNLNLSGDIKATGSANELEWVKISGSNGLDGIYQIINHISDSDITINLEFNAGNTFAGATVQYYYRNYHAVIKVFGGLNSSHNWAGQKAYEELAELKFVPDEDNVITVNIAEVLKSKIETIKNNLLLGTLPNNIDAFCQFYISSAESYDQADGYTIQTFEDSFTSDQGNFEGQAVNAKLPFKNRYSGSLSEYVAARSVQNVNEAKFLTPFGTPTLFADRYFDLSWIRDQSLAGGAYGNDIRIIKEIFIGGSGKNVYSSTIVDNDEGVYRIQLSEIESEDEQQVYLVDDDFGEHILAPSSWTDASAQTWDTKTATQFQETNISSNSESPIIVYQLADLKAGQICKVNFTIAVQQFSGISGNNSLTVSMFAADPGGSSVSTRISMLYTNNNITGDFSESQTEIFKVDTDAARLYLRIDFAGYPGGGNSSDIIITVTPGEYIGYNDLSLLTERKNIKISSECFAEEIYLTWLNHLGGYDYWLFTGQKAVGTDITESQETRKDIFAGWPNSYDEFADTIRHQTRRDSRRTFLVRSQHLDRDEVEAISMIKSSPLVQILTSIYDKRTVIVDKDSFIILEEADKLYALSFTISYTDDLPSQSQ